jgi:hypothetical protein
VFRSCVSGSTDACKSRAKNLFVPDAKFVLGFVSGSDFATANLTESGQCACLS